MVKMTRYHCSNCDIDFELDTDEGAPRCPECLRQHGIEEPAQAARPAPTSSHSRRGLAAALVIGLLAIAAAVGLWLHWHSQRPPPRTLGALAPQALQEDLARRGVPRDDRVDPFQRSTGITSLAARARGGTPQKKARSLAPLLAGALRAARLRVDLRGTGDAAVRTAAELQKLLDEKPKKEHPVLSFELAAHAVAVLRAAGLEAVLCQVHRLKAPMSTAEAEAGIGRYVAAVFPAGKASGKPVAVLDPSRALPLPRWAGGGEDKTMASLHTKLVPLDDASAAGHLLALRAFRARVTKPDRAYQLSGAALAAAAPSATLLLIRAKVLAAAGGTKDAVAAAQEALALRDAPPARTLLGLALAGEGGPAISHLEQALQLDPHYWPADRALASILLPVDIKRAVKYLDAGLKVAPDQPDLLLLQANRLLAEDRATEAASLLEQLVQRHPSELGLLMWYRALLAAGQPDKAAPVRERLLTQAKDRAKMSQMLEALDRAAAPPESPPPLPKRPPELKLPDVSL